MAIIEKLKNSKTGKVYNNVELTKACYNELKRLRDGEGAKNKKEKTKMMNDFFTICGGSENSERIMNFMKAVDEAPSYEEAQEILQNGLIPVDIALLR